MTYPRPAGSGYYDHWGAYVRVEQTLLFPGPEQLCLAEQLTLLDPAELGGHGDVVPKGIMPVAPPDAPAALRCVEQVVADASARLAVATPRIGWFRPVPVPDGEESYEHVRGMVFGGQRTIWLTVRYRSPQQLARTAAHEVVHRWQFVRRGSAIDDLEHEEREREAQRRAEVLVPKGMFPTPRGRKRDAWFEPSRRRYG
jgi:hypothetical protein